MNKELYVGMYAGELTRIADGEYISARSLFKADFWESYLMTGQQCIEKYLKAILLYNGISIKKYGHNLEPILNKVTEIESIKIFLEDIKKEKGMEFYNNVARGIETFNYAEHIKYGVISFSYKAASLFVLDDFVFIFRRFCQNAERYNIATKRYKLFNRHLEKVLENKEGKLNEQYKYLTWKNFYWGKRNKRRIRFKDFWRSRNPVFFSTNPKPAYEALKDYIKIPPELKKYLESLK